MKYAALAAPLMLLVLSALLTSCCHTKYTEAPSQAIHMFHLDDDVVLSADSTPCKNNLSVCKNTGVVVDIIDDKTRCYPQAAYEIKFYHHVDTYIFCSADLILTGASHD